MTWQSVTFSVPASLTALQTTVSGVTEAAPGELTNSAARLSAVNGSVAMTTNPVATTAALCAGLRADMDALMAAGGKFVCVHPYQHPLGDRRGDYAYLTPQDAVAALAAKLADPADLAPSGTIAALALMIREASDSAFQASLAAFNTVFPVTALQLAERRSGWLATLERDKLIQSVGPVAPPWHNGDPRRHSAMTRLDGAMGGLIAVSEAYDAENKRPETELAELISEKSARVGTLASAWASIVSTFTGDTGLGMYATGDAGSIRRAFLSSSPPAASYKLTAIACWVAPAENLVLLKELFGL